MAPGPWEGRFFKKSSTRWAGARKPPPPAWNAARSHSSWKRTPASGPALAGKSSGTTPTRKPPLMFFPSRARKLMPLVTTCPWAEEAATTSPPGHTQKVKADRPVGRWQASL